ncbi:hypothetical protein ACFZDG_26700 [Kitasatospora xanthocidica]|uniref:hypothetical protein n=1 Tax=Kitasatospora xanthocidica TaxID=83382 RepID=UPI0036EE8266
MGHRQARIDEQLAPTIEACWRGGFRDLHLLPGPGRKNTSWVEKLPHMARYVESRRGWMLIDFPVDSGLAFLSAVANAGPRDAFYVRMTHWAAPDAWDVKVKPMDAAMFREESASQFGLRLLQVSFPAYDRPELTRRLREHAAVDVWSPHRSTGAPSAAEAQHQRTSFTHALGPIAVWPVDIALPPGCPLLGWPRTRAPTPAAARPAAPASAGNVFAGCCNSRCSRLSSSVGGSVGTARAVTFVATG